MSNAPSEFRYDVCLSFAGKDPMPQGSRCNLVRRVKTNTFVTDFDEFQKCGDVRMRYFGVATPTSTTVGVTRLAAPDFMIEIEAVAVVNS